MVKTGAWDWGLGVFCCLMLGCASTPTALLPVATPCPAPPPLVRPRLAVQELKPVAAPSEVFRAYVVTVEQLRGYAEELEIIISGYRVSPALIPQSLIQGDNHGR